MTEWETLPTSGAALGGGTDGWVNGDGVRLHYVARGSGPLVVLLHGFPELWYGWRHQLPALAAAGFRAVALDLRGYNLSGRPTRVEDYALHRVAADVEAAIAELGGPAHAVVGHDWGGMAAWRLSVQQPDAFGRLAILNAPHPNRFRELLRRPAQLARSWYVGAVQLPWVPEWLLRRGDHAALVAALRAEHARPGALTRADEAVYRAALRMPGAVHAALSYYRAAARRPRHALAAPRTTPHPTLVLWGMRDGALVRANVDGLERWVPDVRVERVEEARHFVQWDAPARVNAALVAFLRAG